ncbi:MAG: hypothetical protein RLZZ427_33 [Pseudomonadota bacterium]
MSIHSRLTGRLAAAVSAFTLSLILIGATVASPGTAYAQTTYLGVIA